ncbi:hypothetical protein [Streptomyces halobius]|uniref:Glycosyl transferase family 2 n=1 Tax=Streptomyces halobius TaxID=2879846 RepID=A0ABY4MN90_9ACTN|nr:hypothetical protein [Streptomyces halobius]UQA98189.1 hypothetical protein K9S39_12240 [Streptomyces halobius]
MYRGLPFIGISTVVYGCTGLIAVAAAKIRSTGELSMHTVTFLVPAHHEEEGLPATLESLCAKRSRLTASWSWTTPPATVRARWRHHMA